MRSLTVFGFLVLLLPCAGTHAQTQFPIGTNYAATALNSFDFGVRSGGSRGNDDKTQQGLVDIRHDIPESEEGNFETSIFDLELFGRKMPQGIFVVANVTANVVEEAHPSSDSAKIWGARSLGYERLNANKQWQTIVPSTNVGSTFSYEPLDNLQKGSFSQGGKYQAPEDRPILKQPSGLLKVTVPVGMLQDGIYRGRFTLEQHSGRAVGSKIQYPNPDLNNYNTTRHIVEWHLNIVDGRLAKTTEFIEDAFLDAAKPRVFNNQIGFITPPWHGSEVVENGVKVKKYHHVGLMWRDVVRKSDDGRNYLKTDLMPIILATDSGEHIGRLPKKTDVFGEQSRQISGNNHGLARSSPTPQLNPSPAPSAPAQIFPWRRRRN